MKKNIVSLRLVVILMTTICIPAFATNENCCGLDHHEHDATDGDIGPLWEEHCPGGRLITVETSRYVVGTNQNTCQHGKIGYVDKWEVYSVHYKSYCTGCSFVCNFTRTENGPVRCIHA